MSEEIKSCPFCCDIALLQKSLAGYYVVCTNCFVSTSRTTNKDIAITVWNRRASKTQLKDNN